MGTQMTIYHAEGYFGHGNGAYHTERNALLAASQIAQLQQRLATVQSENTELNRRLSAQNRPSKQLGGCIEVASMILSEHVAGHPTGRRTIKAAYPQIGRRRWSWGVALLRMAGIVIGNNQYGLLFNSQLSVNRAWQKLTNTAENLAQTPDAIDQLRYYLPASQRA